MKNNSDIKFDTAYSKFYELLIDRIPSLDSYGKKASEIILNVDLIMKEAKKNSYNYVSKSIEEPSVFEFDAINYEDEEILDLMFHSYSDSDIGAILLMQNSNPHGPIECDFCNLKKEIDLLPMSIFPGGDVVILWKQKKIVSLFHHTGYFAHILCE